MIASAVTSALTSSVMQECSTDCVISGGVKRTEGKICVYLVLFLCKGELL